MTQTEQVEQTTVVSRWFGKRFSELHPLLQSLHLKGGTLRGMIEIRTGAGLAAWIGKRLAASLGIPVDKLRRGFEVEIRHTSKALEWRRTFDNGQTLVSIFEPVGVWPQGYWIERTGPLSLQLTVDVNDGAWQWRPLRASYRGLRLPLCLLPQSRAGKRIVDGKYVFHVEFALPVMGKVLSYSGTLDADAANGGLRQEG
ncbi:MAG: DUF4166 domain-containing protein [Pseudomonadota bacterium]